MDNQPDSIEMNEASWRHTHLCFGEAETGRQLFALLPDDVVVLVERFLQL